MYANGGTSEDIRVKLEQRVTSIQHLLRHTGGAINMLKSSNAIIRSGTEDNEELPISIPRPPCEVEVIESTFEEYVAEPI